jgi:hypothetical protein
MQAALRPGGRVGRHLGGAAEWLVRLHVLTRDGQRLDASALEGLLGAGDALPAGGASWRDGVCAARVPMSLGHGDYWVRNLLLDEEGAITAVLDWERARPHRPPTEDLFHLVLTYALNLRWPGGGRVTAEEAFERAFLKPGPVAREIGAVLLRYCAAAGIDPQWLRALLLLHLATGLPLAGLPGETGRALAERFESARWSVFGG